MTAQQINGNCLSRSTRDFFYSFFDPSSSCSLFCGLVFPSPTLPSMRQYRVFSSTLVAFSIPTRLFIFFRYLSRSRPPTFRLTCRTKLQNAAPPPMAAFRSSCFVRATSCVLVEKKDGPSEETVWRRRRGACSSSEYRRGVYAALIVGTQFSFAAIQHSTKTFLFFFFSFHQSTLQPYIYRPSLYSFTFLFLHRTAIDRLIHPAIPPFPRHCSFQQHRFCFNTILLFDLFFYIFHSGAFFIARKLSEKG